MENSKSSKQHFARNIQQTSSGSSTRSSGHEQCRKRLKDKFEECDNSKLHNSSSNRSILSTINFEDTRKYLRNGTERISKTFSSIRVGFGTFTQRFKNVARRRQILEEGPMTPNPQTPYSNSKQVLGRTPTKLYSPFGIDSPYYNKTTVDKKDAPPTLIGK